MIDGLNGYKTICFYLIKVLDGSKISMKTLTLNFEFELEIEVGHA